MRIAIVTEIPAPFRIPLWNALAARDDVDLRVLLLRERDPRRTYDLHREEWRFDARILPGWSTFAGRRWLVLSANVGRELRRFRPDVLVVGGWNQPAFFRAAAYARRRGTPLVLWVESTSRDERAAWPAVERLKKWLAGSAQGVLVPGRAAADYVRSLGVLPERIAVVPNAFDLEAFSGAVARERRRRDELRGELGIDGCSFLTVSRLSREKGVDLLVRAFEGVPAELVVVGDGPQNAELRRDAPANVRFAGRLARDELPRRYAAADAFVLASRSETWGMVLNEAAAAGLPLVATEAPGAAWELIEPDVNGLRVPVGDEAALRSALVKVATDQPFRARASTRSRELAAQPTPEAWADGVTRLARRVLTT